MIKWIKDGDNVDEKIIRRLIDEAKEIALRNFCANHSNFTVGASLMTSDGVIYKGFNIENDGIQSICAERVAFAKALTDNRKDFTCMAVVGKKIEDPNFIKTLPCGYCRQFIKEYTNPDFIIYTYDELTDKIYSYTIKELLPESFTF